MDERLRFVAALTRRRRWRRCARSSGFPVRRAKDQFSTERERPPFKFTAPPGNVAPRNVQLNPVHWYQLLSGPRT